MSYFYETRDKALSIGKGSGLWNVPHLHQHLEIVYVLEGSTVAYVDNKPHPMYAGDFLITFPNQIHYYLDQQKTLHYCSIIHPDLLKDFNEILLTKYPVDPVLHADALPSDLVDRLEKIHQTYKANPPLALIMIKGLLLTLFAEILPRMSLTDNTTDQDTAKRLLIYCSEHFDEPLSLDTLADALHLSKYHISRIFNERMGIGFSYFINRLRIDRARELLRSSQNITDVAFDSGFSSIRTFNRQFLQTFGITPSEYIKKMQSGK